MKYCITRSQPEYPELIEIYTKDKIWSNNVPLTGIKWLPFELACVFLKRFSDDFVYEIFNIDCFEEE